MPRVSVIVPNYNHAAYLDRRLSSVLAQTFTDFELICLDDASTDESLQVMDRYAGDSRMRVITNATNSGSPYKQWNRGLREAVGDYVWIAESDDFADATLLETLVARLDADPKIGLAYCQSWIIDRAGNVLHANLVNTDALDRERWKSDYTASGVEECATYLIRKNTIPNASAVVFRRTLFERYGPVREDLALCGDWLFWIELLLHSDVAYVASCLNYYRTHDGNVRGPNYINGVIQEERLHVIRRISGSLGMSRSAIRPAVSLTIGQWEKLMCTPGNAIPASRNLRIGTGLVRLDPAVAPRVLLAITRHALVRTHLHGVASGLKRSWRAATR